MIKNGIRYLIFTRFGLWDLEGGKDAIIRSGRNIFSFVGILLTETGKTCGRWIGRCGGIRMMVGNVENRTIFEGDNLHKKMENL